MLNSSIIVPITNLGNIKSKTATYNHGEKRDRLEHSEHTLHTVNHFFLGSSYTPIKNVDIRPPFLPVPKYAPSTT